MWPYLADRVVGQADRWSYVVDKVDVAVPSGSSCWAGRSVVVYQMFVEAVVFLSAIIGVLLALSSFVFHMITRDRSGVNFQEDIEGAVDAVCDAALEEINKTSKLVIDELDEKYKALLFVYQLMDDKEKNLSGEKTELSSVAQMPASLNELADEKQIDGIGLDISVDDELDFSPFENISTTYNDFIEPENTNPAEIEPKTETSSFSNRISAHPKYTSIKELIDGGLSVSEVARRLEMGQGEVQLIIGFSGGGSR